MLRCSEVSRPMSLVGQSHALPRRSIAVRFTPVSGIDSRSQGLLSRANSEHCPVSRRRGSGILLMERPHNLWGNRETSPPAISASGRRRCRAAGRVADRAGASLSDAAGADHRRLPRRGCRQQYRDRGGRESATGWLSFSASTVSNSVNASGGLKYSAACKSTGCCFSIPL